MITPYFFADLLMGCVYIPPENTKYASTDTFSDIENEMFNLVKNGEHVSLLGDFNAKSGKLSDRDVLQHAEKKMNIY
jgi:hypothetical protein